MRALDDSDGTQKAPAKQEPGPTRRLLATPRQGGRGEGRGVPRHSPVLMTDLGLVLVPVSRNATALRADVRWGQRRATPALTRAGDWTSIQPSMSTVSAGLLLKPQAGQSSSVMQAERSDQDVPQGQS